MQSKRLIYSSRYLTMRDGVRIAVDLYLPAGLRDGEKRFTHRISIFRSGAASAPGAGLHDHSP